MLPLVLFKKFLFVTFLLSVSLLGMVTIQFALQGKIPLYPEMEKNQSCQ